MPIDRRWTYGLLTLGFACLACIGVGVLIFNFYHAPEVVRSSDATPPNKLTTSKTVTIDARQVWTDTGIEIKRGDILTIDATGQVNVASPGDGADKWVSPDGWGYIPLLYCGSQPCSYVYRTPDSMGCLIGKIEGGKAFKVGHQDVLTATISGKLFLGVNDAVSDASGNLLDDSRAASLMFSDNRGAFTVAIKVE